MAGGVNLITGLIPELISCLLRTWVDGVPPGGVGETGLRSLPSLLFVKTIK